jgi:CheY-like chemotaxis protein
VEPVSNMVASAAFLAAHVARNPADPLATVLWDRVKSALRRVLNREPTPRDVSSATIRAAANAEPAAENALHAVRSMSTGLRRAEIVEKVLRGARILWVEDGPDNSAWERELLHSLGAVVVPSESPQAALASLQQEAFHVVVAGMHTSADSGSVAADLRGVAAPIPIVVYVREASVTSANDAAGTTNEPNELLHLVLDRLERARI